ncbi:MAG: hydrogenase maturation protease [Bryobacteraceae bacterium]
MSRRMLIAGIGNVFRGDDGFGVEVARRLLMDELPGWVRVADFGIHGVELAHELLDGDYQLTILVDASRHGRAPGTVSLIEPDLRRLEEALDPEPQRSASLKSLKRLGGHPGRIVIVGCEPEHTEESFGLSHPVEEAVKEAMGLIRNLIQRQAKKAARETGAAPRTAAMG